MKDSPADHCHGRGNTSNIMGVFLCLNLCTEFPLISPQEANLMFRVKARGLINFFYLRSCIKILNIRDEYRRKKNSLKIQNGTNTFIILCYLFI